MIKRLIGAVAGREAAKHTAAVGGTGGAILGALVVPLIARLSIPTMLAVTAGGYIAKRLYDKRQAQQPAAPRTASTDTGTEA
jgi:hypothetical protein